MSGTGKSTVAGCLAPLLRRRVVDLDAGIEEASGMPISELFAAEGEETFRDLESGALADALAGPPAVIACGGGILGREKNRRALAERAVVVWLTARLATMTARLGPGRSTRPLLAEDGALERLERERRHLYMGAADLVVATDSLTPEEVAHQVLDRLQCSA